MVDRQYLLDALDFNDDFAFDDEVGPKSGRQWLRRHR